MLQRVGRLADGWPTCTATPREYEDLFGRVKRAAKEAGRDPRGITGGYQMTCGLREDPNRARREALDFLNKYYVTEFTDLSQSMWARDPFGTLEDIIRNIEGLASVGCRHFCIRFASCDQFGQMRLFAEKVLPHFR
jgi:alkanesulfonate monooxygenase SsuD/methylene tetrahydromethanopterin reductase-like flavin-dependent oxidoreductase (luciferase family)